MGSETFASLWMALQNSYEGTNITRTVARLLHMYQPEDGLEAYERLLQTLYVLLGDFDSRGFKLLVSIIPPPKEIPEDIVEDIFEKAVGFTRMTTLPDSRFLDFGTDDDDSSNQIINLEKNSSNIEDTIENSQSDFESKNESTEQIDETCELPSTSSDYRMKFISTPYTLRKNAICQSTHLYQENFKNQNIEDDEDDFCKIEDSLGVFKKPEVVDVPKKKISRRSRKKSPEIKNSVQLNNNREQILSQEKQKKIIPFQNTVDDETKISKQTEKRLIRKLRYLQRAIQEDIFKMDVVHANSKEIEIIPIRRKKQKFLEPSDFDINNNLSRSIENFLHRIKGEEETPKENIEKVQIITPSNNDPISDETAAFIDCWKKIITKSVLGRDPEPYDLCSTNMTKGKPSVVRRKGSAVKKETERRKVNRKKTNVAKRKKVDVSLSKNQKSECKSEERENSYSDSLNITEQLSNSDLNNFVLEESNLRSRSNSDNMIKNEELMDHQQYCNSMLNIHNTEDLSASSSREYDYNQYYFDYLQREYQLLEQRLSMGIPVSNEQFSVPNHQFTTDSWTKSKSKNWNFPSFKQSQCPQHHRPVRTSAVNSPVFNFVPEENVSIEIIDCEEHEFNQLANDPNVVQQNLEDVFVVVKDSENVSINPSSN
ncbi:uncharacterized protein LOC127284713 isoform X2 [Leptopilina boulardi]|nr:uncharacterized protein LOC127284713 isoform X2 [Leptopilina boulardi]